MRPALRSGTAGVAQREAAGQQRARQQRGSSAARIARPRQRQPGRLRQLRVAGVEQLEQPWDALAVRAAALTRGRVAEAR